MEQESPQLSSREQAARWFAARRRPLGTLAEREAYRRWIADPAHRDEYAQMQALWAALEPAAAASRPAADAVPTRRVMLAVGGLAVATLGLMGCMQGPFWTALDWATR